MKKLLLTTAMLIAALLGWDVLLELFIYRKR
jgi:hypothetical protein